VDDNIAVAPDDLIGIVEGGDGIDVFFLQMQLLFL
jgi:hypothetical protein